MDNPICPECNRRKCGKLYYKGVHTGGYRKTCQACRGSSKRITNRTRSAKPSYRSHKTDKCSNPTCTSTILDPCQLDVDHIDDDHSNDELENLQTLCSVCHRLKTWRPDLYEKQLLGIP